MKAGEKIFVKTVTNYFVGLITAIDTAPDGAIRSVTLGPAAWVADTARRQGRFLADGVDQHSEIECYPAQVLIPWHCVTEVSPWLHAIPTVSQ